MFCNNRLLLIADKSAETGWGRGAAAYHPQYRLFRGYVYMSATDTSLLPWNTTKTGVDSDSPVWRKVQAPMVAVLVEVQAVLNRIKKEREAELDDELEGLTPEDLPYLRALESARPTPPRELPMSEEIAVPQKPKRRKGNPRPRLQRVQYDIPQDKCDRAMAELRSSFVADWAGEVSTTSTTGRSATHERWTCVCRADMKDVTRRIFANMLHQLDLNGDLRRYQYIGFGALEFIDFDLVHPNLGINDLFSIEKSGNIDRYEANKPYQCIDLLHGNSTDKLTEIDWKRLSIVWLDYESTTQRHGLDRRKVLVPEVNPRFRASDHTKRSSWNFEWATRSTRIDNWRGSRTC